MGRAETIPGILATAAERNRDGVWLRTDEGTLTFGGAVAHFGVLAERLREVGVQSIASSVVVSAFRRLATRSRVE